MAAAKRLARLPKEVLPESTCPRTPTFTLYRSAMAPTSLPADEPSFSPLVSAFVDPKINQQALNLMIDDAWCSQSSEFL